MPSCRGAIKLFVLTIYIKVLEGLMAKQWREEVVRNKVARQKLGALQAIACR